MGGKLEPNLGAPGHGLTTETLMRVGENWFDFSQWTLLQCILNMRLYIKILSDGVDDETLAKTAFQEEIIPKEVRQLPAFHRAESRKNDGYIAAIQDRGERIVSKSFPCYIICHQGVGSTEDGHIGIWRNILIRIFIGDG